MKRIPRELLERMGRELPADDRDEMAIPSYLHKNPAMRWMAWRRLEVIARHLEWTCSQIKDGVETVLMDYGCGSGVLFDEASHYAQRIYGVDLVLDAARLLVAEWKLERVLLLTPEDASREIPRGSVDVILAAEVLEHVEPLGETLEFFKSRLRTDGRLLTSLPTETALYRLGRRLAGFHGEYHHSNAASIDREILRSGFERQRLDKVPAPGPLAIYWVAAYRPV